MARSLREVISKLPPERRRHIAARIEELTTLRDIRTAAARTQQELARTLGVGQDTISRIERRSDLLLSTLRRYVEAMGGTLDLVVRFPDRPAVRIEHLSDDSRLQGASRRATEVHEMKPSYRVKRAPATSARGRKSSAKR